MSRRIGVWALAVMGLLATQPSIVHVPVPGIVHVPVPGIVHVPVPGIVHVPVPGLQVR